MKTAKGLHLWIATYGYTKLQVTTRFKSPQLALKRAQQAAKENGVLSFGFASLEHKGTIDA